MLAHGCLFGPPCSKFSNKYVTIVLHLQTNCCIVFLFFQEDIFGVLTLKII